LKQERENQTNRRSRKKSSQERVSNNKTKDEGKSTGNIGKEKKKPELECKLGGGSNREGNSRSSIGLRRSAALKGTQTTTRPVGIFKGLRNDGHSRNTGAKLQEKMGEGAVRRTPRRRGSKPGIG